MHHAGRIGPSALLDQTWLCPVYAEPKHSLAGTSCANRQYEYEKIGGLYVPKSFRWVLDNGKATEETLFITECVNEPLPEDEFTLKKLGIVKGDIVHDARLDLTYKFGENMDEIDLSGIASASGTREHTVATMNDGLPPSGEARDKGRSRVTDSKGLIIVGVIILLLAIAGLIRWLRKRSRRH